MWAKRYCIQIGNDKSASRHVGFAAEVKLRSERMSVI